MNPEAAVDYSIVPLLLLLTSLLPGVIIFFLREDRTRLRTALNLFGALSKVAFVVVLIPPVVAGEKLRASMEWAPGIDIVLTTDAFSLFFVGLSAALWLVTTIYAIGYLGGSPNQSRFFGFFSLCVTATTGIALAGNLLTFLLFFELLTLVTYPLVAHRGTKEALNGARTYLIYTLGGGALVLIGVVWLTVIAGPVEFVSGGAPEVAAAIEEHPVAMTAIGGLLLVGMGVKAAIFPLHGWLPVAMVAPAPVSALLHAVAVVKAGAFGIVRVVHDLFGLEAADRLGLLSVLAAFAGFTIIYGSVRALMQDDLKRRLAYSTVSQLSYVALGAALIAPLATSGALVHIVHQGLMKITLFFCAGLFAEVIGVSKVSGLRGAGRRMPLTSLAFTIGAFGMIGLPPLAGFVSKWPLALGGLDAEAPWVVGVLVVSTLLNAAYFLPVVYALWFTDPDPGADWSGRRSGTRRFEAPHALLWPAVTTAALSVVVGVAAGWGYSPWSLAEFIAEGSYR